MVNIFAGLWIQSTNEETALEAAKMTGFPTMMIGVIGGMVCFFLAALNFALAFMAWEYLTGLNLLSVVLIFISLRVRSGKIAYVPILCLISTLVWAVSVALIIMQFFERGYSNGLALQGTIGIVLTTLYMIIALSGLNGWRYLRAVK